MNTKKPVTGSGWYELENGTLAKFAWTNDGLKQIATAADWVAAKNYDEVVMNPPKAQS